MHIFFIQIAWTYLDTVRFDTFTVFNSFITHIARMDGNVVIHYNGLFNNTIHLNASISAKNAAERVGHTCIVIYLTTRWWRYPFGYVVAEESSLNFQVDAQLYTFKH